MDKQIDSFRIAQNIKNIRKRFNLTQVEMAEKLGYSERQIRRIETEGTMNLDILNYISVIFNISVLDILIGMS